MNKRKTAGKKKEKNSKDNNTRIKERKMQAHNLQSKSESGKHISKRYGENRRKLECVHTSYLILLPTYTIFAQTKPIFQKHLNKLRLYPFTDQEITKTLQSRDLSQFCLFVLSKPLEKHINKHLLSCLETNELIHPNQSGFSEHH